MMQTKKAKCIIRVLFLLCLTRTHLFAKEKNQSLGIRDMKLYYTKAAEQTAEGWEQKSLPIGNGFIGASIFGGIRREYLHLNEKTLWTGGPCKKRPNYSGGNKTGVDENGYTPADYFAKIRTLFSEGKDAEAAALCDKLVGEKASEGYGAYQSFGKFFIDFYYSAHTALSEPPAEIKAYRRELDLNQALVEVRYQYNTTEYRRMYFANYPSNVLAGKITASNPVLHCSVHFESDQGGSISYTQNGFTLSGKVEDNDLEFLLRCRIRTDGITTCSDKGISITQASFLEFFLCSATDYSDSYPKYRTGFPPHIDEANLNKSFDALLAEHIKDYCPLFDRCRLNIGQDSEPDMPTDVLLSEYKNGKFSRKLEDLLFQYGRYLLLSSSREKNILPANLQGMWNNSNSPPWASDYHLNINLQMNYWLACVTGLPECCIPLVKYVAALEKPAERTAKAYTGLDGGLMIHTQNTPFGWTCPGWSFDWGWSPAAFPWILQNLWQYYCASGDFTRLKEIIYPLFKKEMQFYTAVLVFDKKQNRLVSSPTYSPEHGPRTNGNTYEQSLIWELFKQGIEAAKLCGEKKALIAQWKKVQENLKPIVIGKSGQILEWYTEEELGSIGEKHHRHISHLLGVYPGTLITKEDTDLAAAAKRSLESRGDKSTGWAMAQRILTWARLGEGKRAYAILQTMIQTCIYDNLLATHPPFQIDGNFGLTAAIAELFLHCADSLPDEWQGATLHTAKQ
ncbi:glycoside hydrolase family 95 protein [Treponema phagedenis]|uniref:Glycoside hydrolase family 95 protein n=1 Tax=Treponema phagedenis TaxID=162 RepID=A0AAE6ITL2_TREPH|nr:glycoside hydrolase family 95 protein [Treponema phagedenis]QEJ98074.1 glycoside hydrolase family 95 protein [Treponema phagedenis]QEK01103.1 glycoside hydrolase family 95 protein [Treponema phagedenis]QEK03579.1 glycoside hydrolase family 95 protein [Treponema phagedenis]QEK06111.1 glycoside hydrolase family 95 protein [Treponema phagedenis]QEK09199.1 glycoside hydrolase family 95 protein [Treponema phagedenis]